MEDAKDQTEAEDLKGQDAQGDQDQNQDQVQDTQDGQNENNLEDPEEPKKAEEPPAEPDWKDRYARAMADFDNFRKRTARDREDLEKFAASDVL